MHDDSIVVGDLTIGEDGAGSSARRASRTPPLPLDHDALTMCGIYQERLDGKMMGNVGSDGGYRQHGEDATIWDVILGYTNTLLL